MDWGSLTGGPSGILRGFQGDGSRMNRNLRAALASLLKTTQRMSMRTSMGREMRKTHVDKDKDKIKDEEEPESSPGFTAQDNLLAFLPRIQLEVDNVPANIQKTQFKLGIS